MILKTILFISKFSSAEHKFSVCKQLVEIFSESDKNSEVNLQDIFSCLKDTLKTIESDINSTIFNILSENYMSYNFTVKIFSKLENILNIFFDHR